MNGSRRQHFIYSAQLWAGINCLLDTYQYFLVGTMCIVVFFDQKQYVIDVYLDLLYKLNFKDYIVCYILGILLVTPVSPLIPEVLVPAKIVLKISF